MFFEHMHKSLNKVWKSTLMVVDFQSSFRELQIGSEKITEIIEILLLAQLYTFFDIWAPNNYDTHFNFLALSQKSLYIRLRLLLIRPV